MEWHEIGGVEALAEGALLQADVGGRAVCVGRIAGGWVAFDDTDRKSVV